MTDRSVLVRLRVDPSQFVAGTKAAAAAVRDLGNDIDKSNDRTAWLAQGILALAPAVTTLGAGAVPVLSGMATQMTLTVAAAGTMAIAFNGVGDALGALNDYQLDPTAANLEKLNEAMGKIGPAGRDLVEFLDSLGPTLTTIANTSRSGMFPGITEGLESMLELAPKVNSIIRGISEGIGELAAQGGGELAGPRFEQFFEYLDTRAKPLLIEMGQTLGNFTLGLANMMAEFDPLTSDFSAGLLEMSRSFASWSETFASTQGFQEFVSYVREAGPQALDFLGSLIMALVELAEAAAPIGSVMLPVLTGMLNLLGDLANTPLGPLTIGFLALTSAWGRVNALAQITGSGVMAKATSGIKGNYTAAREAVPTFRQLGNAMAFSVFNQKALTASMESGSVAARTSAANALNARGQVMAFGRSVAPVAGQVGLLAVATSSLDDKLGLTNTTSLALAGSLAGPWGAAVGAGAGLLLDMKAGADQATEGLKGLDEAAASKNIEALTQRIAEAKKEMADQESVTGFGDFFSDAMRDIGASGSDSAMRVYADAIAEAEAELADLKNAQAEVANDDALFNALQRETDALEDNIAAMRAKREEALRAASAELNYAGSLLDTRDAAKKYGDVLARNGDLMGGPKQQRAGIEAKQQLLELAGAWNGLSDEAQNAPGAFRRARAALVEAAESMGMGERAAKRYADEIMNIPTKWSTRIELDANAASQRARDFQAQIDALRDGYVTIHVSRRNTGEALPFASGGGSSMDQTPRSADGSTVPDSGKGYADRFLYLLADGEEVVSNRRRQASRYRPVLKAINADMPPSVIKGMLADGGTTGDKKKRRRKVDLGLEGVIEIEFGPSEEQQQLAADNAANAQEQAEAQRKRAEEQAEHESKLFLATIEGQEKAAQDLIAAAEAQKSSAEQVLEGWTQAMSRVGAAATADFRSSGFGQSQQRGIWAGGPGTQSGWRAALSGDIAGLQERGSLINQLSGAGVTGTALENLLGEASNAEIQQLLGSGEAGAYAAMFAQREALLGSVSTQAGQAAYGSEYAAASAAVAAVDARLQFLEAQLSAITAQRPVSIYESVSAAATAAEVVRLTALGGAA